MIMAYDGKYQPKNYTYNYIIYTRIHSRKKHNMVYINGMTPKKKTVQIFYECFQYL